MLQPSTSPCRMVRLEWDRSHEDFEAIVHAGSPSGVVVSELRDLSPMPGLRWIKDSEILDLTDLPTDAPEVRLADARGDRLQRVDPSMTELPTLLKHLRSTGELIAVYTERTGSSELLVGPIIELDGGRVVLADVELDGAMSGGRLDYDLDEIVAVDWETTYLVNLAELGRLAATSDGAALTATSGSP